MPTIIPPASPPIDTRLPKREPSSSRSSKTKGADETHEASKRRARKTEKKDDDRDEFNVVLGHLIGTPEQTSVVSADLIKEVSTSLEISDSVSAAPIPNSVSQALDAASAVKFVGTEPVLNDSSASQEALLADSQLAATAKDLSMIEDTADAQSVKLTMLQQQAAARLEANASDIGTSLKDTSEPIEFEVDATPEAVVSAETRPTIALSKPVVQPTAVTMPTNTAVEIQTSEEASTEFTVDPTIQPPLVLESRRPSDSEEPADESVDDASATEGPSPSAATESSDSGSIARPGTVALPSRSSLPTNNGRISPTQNLPSIRPDSLTTIDRGRTSAVGESSFNALEHFWSQHTELNEASRGEQASLNPAKEEPAAADLAPTSRVSQMSSNETVTNGSMATMETSTAMASPTRQPLSSQVSSAILEQLARQPDRDRDSITIKLDPPELGEMTIELSKTNGGLAVRVTAREAVTMDMLFSRGDEIESHLRDKNLDLESLEFLAPGLTSAGMSGGNGSQGQQHSRNAESEALASGLQRTGRRATTAASSPNPRANPNVTDSNHALTFRA